MNIDILAKDGTKKGSVELNPALFDIEPNAAVMHQAVKMHLANRRQGTHKAKERSEVRGGGKKPWRQKGRGVARAGSSRSPLWVGGGTIFGPRPHSYRQQMPKKMRRLARRSALSLKARSNEILIVDTLVFNEVKTKAFASMLKAINVAGKKALVLLAEGNETTLMSGRNIPNCAILNAREASTFDLLNNQILVIEEQALAVLEALLIEQTQKGEGRGTVDTSSTASKQTESEAEVTEIEESFDTLEGEEEGNDDDIIDGEPDEEEQQ